MVAASTTVSADPKDPRRLVRARYSEIEKVIESSPSKKTMKRGIRRVLDSFVDYRVMGERALSVHWNGLDRRQRKDFIGGFKKMIQRTYVKRFNANRKVVIDYRGETDYTDDGTAIVLTTVHSGKSEAKVDYHFRSVRGRWKAFDVIIDDISQVKNYRRQFHRIIGKEGFDGLMSLIRKKNEKEASKE